MIREPITITSKRVTRIVSLALAFLMCAGITLPAMATDYTPVLWYASRSSEADANWLFGDNACEWGDPDCNVCAESVVEQLDDAMIGFDPSNNGYPSVAMGWDEKRWHFDWDTHYPPDDLTPTDIIKGDIAKHVQGFVRTNSSKYRFAGSHSDDKTGSIFFIQQNSDGRKILTSLHESNETHPSGVQVLGQYLFVAEKSHLRVFDVERARDNQNGRYVINPGGKGLSKAGGGLALAKLDGPGYLLIASTPGSDADVDKFNRFFYLEGDLTNPTRQEFLGEHKLDYPNAWDEDFKHSENLSVITECGTGHIYTLHVSGFDAGPAGIGYWRLSRVDWDSSGPKLVPIRLYATQSNLFSCHTRSAGTAHVNAWGLIDLYCHEWRTFAQENYRFEKGTNYTQ